MAMITATVIITKTVATLDAPTITAILDWINTNIKNKLPTDTTLAVQFSIQP